MPVLTAVTCPVEYVLKITEVQATTGGSGSRFVEVYNQGTSVQLEDLSVSGVFNGPVDNSGAYDLPQGAYLVLYDSDSSYVLCHLPPPCWF